MLKQTFFLLVCFSTQAFGAYQDGVYSITGHHKDRGNYQGEIEINNKDVIKIITYKNFKFNNLNVQEVWTGKAETKGNDLITTYSLKKADYIVRLENLVRSPEDFKTPSLITSTYTTNQNSITTTGEYTEKLNFNRMSGAKALWKNERENLPALGDKIPTWLRPFIKISTSRSGFDKDPYVKSFKDRPEFKNVTPFIVFDPTDYDFYQDNPKTLRVVNKVLDPISMTEAISRRNAYAFSLADKADIYQKNMLENHLPLDSGTITTAKLNNQKEFIEFDPDFSGGLWSGLYAGAEAMRFLSTQNPDALDNFKRVLKGMYTLIDITGDPRHFARSIAPYDPKHSKNGYKDFFWTQGRGQYSHLMYLLEGNNDMFKGITHSLMWATYVVPESDTETWNMMRKMAKQILNLEIIEEKKQNKPSAIGLAAIILKDKKLEEKFRGLFNNPMVMLGGYSIDTTFYVRGSADWSGINLGMAGAITEIMIADKLGAHAISKQMGERLMDSWVTYESSKRALVTVTSYAFAYKKGIRGGNFNDLKNNDQKWNEGLNNAMWTLRSVPAIRPTDHIEIDHSMRPDWCLSPVPKLFWKGYKGTPPPSEYFYQGLYDYPIFEGEIYQSNYLWKSGAFTYKNTSNKNMEYSGADYLYLYWLSKYAGLDWN